MPASRPTERIRRAAAALALLAGTACAHIPEPANPDVRVLTFNIRYGSANDGDDRWALRRDIVMDVIRDERPHILGLQEALRFQLDEIHAVLPRFAEIGVGRDDGGREGEYVPLLYDSTTFDRLDAGWFWFSDTPEVPGSSSTLHPHADSVGTFHAFPGGSGGEKIDAVLAGPGWQVDSARIVRTARDGRYPSDHYPVLAVLRHVLTTR